jgi:hypothetical protein
MSYFAVLKGLFNNNTATPLKVDESGSIFSTPNSINSLTNNYTGSFTSGSAWSGSAELNTYQDVMVVLKTDVSGTLYLDFSPDGTNWDSTINATINANAPEFHTALKGPRYYRTRYVNGNDVPSFFRLYTYYGQFRQGNLPLNSTVRNDSDAIVVRAVNLGEDPNGNYINEKTDGMVFMTTSSLSSGSSYVGNLFNTDGFSQIETTIYSDQPGTLIGMWYADAAATKLIRTFTRPYSSTDVGNNVYFSSPIFGPYLKYTYTNGSTGQSDFYLSLKGLTKSISGQVIGLNDFIPSNVVANLGRNVIVGQTDGGVFANVPITPEGHLEVAIHGPRNPFGSIHTEKNSHIFQSDAVYGLRDGQVSTKSTLSGTVQTSQSMFVCSTGTTQFSQAILQSRKRLKYRPGQGIINKFTALYTPPTASSYQLIGLGHAEDGLYVGYSGSSFGILHSQFGIREQRFLNITAASTTNQTVTVVLNNISSSINVTNNNNIQRTAYELSQGTYSGWEAIPSGSGVLFTSNSTGAKNGNYSIIGSIISGSYSTAQTGQNNIETFYSQSQWNGDRLNGLGGTNNPSGVTFDPTKGNVFKINMQYLGFGPSYVEMEVNPNGNNPDFVNLHTINYLNNNTIPVYANPSFPFTMAVYSAGSTADLTLKCASFEGAIEGEKSLTGDPITYSRPVTSVSTTLYTALYTILNSQRYKNRVNQSVINMINGSLSTKLSSNAYGEFYLIKNGTLVGNPTFNNYSSDSVALFDTGSTSVTFTDNKQILATYPFGETTNEIIDLEPLEIDLQPGEYLTVACKLGNGSATYANLSLNTREDQ